MKADGHRRKIFRDAIRMCANGIYAQDSRVIADDRNLIPSGSRNLSVNKQFFQTFGTAGQPDGISAATAADPDPSDEELEGDEMLPAAVDVILETGQASVSMVQRRLKLGYARAARIVDEVEEKGIVGPFHGSKPRSILITKEQWAARSGGSQQMDFDDLEPDFDGVPEEID
jgi:DNA segregation ATPase FtsK/SpoIIIE-like protein